MRWVGVVMLKDAMWFVLTRKQQFLYSQLHEKNNLLLSSSDNPSHTLQGINWCVKWIFRVFNLFMLTSHNTKRRKCFPFFFFFFSAIVVEIAGMKFHSHITSWGLRRSYAFTFSLFAFRTFCCLRFNIFFFTLTVPVREPKVDMFFALYDRASSAFLLYRWTYYSPLGSVFRDFIA